MPPYQLLHDLAEVRGKMRELRAFARTDTLAGECVRASLVQAGAILRRLDFLIETQPDRLYAALREDRIGAQQRRRRSAWESQRDGTVALDAVDFAYMPTAQRSALEAAVRYINLPDTPDTAVYVGIMAQAKQQMADAKQQRARKP